MCDSASGNADIARLENTPPESDRGSLAGDAKGPANSHGVKIANTGAGAKPRKVFSHAGKAAAEKDADITVKEIGEEKKPEKKKKKGMKGLFGKKK